MASLHLVEAVQGRERGTGRNRETKRKRERDLNRVRERQSEKEMGGWMGWKQKHMVPHRHKQAL